MLSRVSLPALAVSTQVAGVLAAFLGLTLAPPAQGTMLLMPIGGTTQGQLATIAIDHGAQIVARGRWDGSIVVQGERARLWQPLTRVGVLVLASTSSGCGTGASA